MIRGTATAGFTVNVHIDGSVAGTTVADGNGNWIFTPASPLADGLHTAAATETDGFGNTGPLSNAVSFTVDTAAPAAPVITTPAEGTLVNTTWPVISGTAEPGSTVAVYIDEVLVGTAVASINGTWSFTPVNALIGGLHSVKVSATDRAGNAGAFSAVLNFSTTPALLGGPGTLDGSFGTGGRILTPIGSGEDRGHAVALQSDGKVVAAGYSHNGSNKDFCVVRYLADGTLDTGFGTDGKVTTDFGGTNDEANGVAIQADGKIVAVGSTLNGSGLKSFALARFNADGTPDTSFGLAGTGKIKPSVGADSAATEARAVRVQPDGKFVVVGRAVIGNTFDFAVLRYNADGTLDTGFGVGGAVFTNLFIGDHGWDLTLQPDGKIVVCGQNSHGSMLVARYNTDGSWDTGFSYAGQSFYSYGVALQEDGKIVLAGATAVDAGSQDFRLTRLNPDGSLDTSFGTNGVVATGIGTALDGAYSIAVQADGRIVAAGVSYNADTGFNDFAVVRYLTNGTLDTSFKSTGKVLGGFTGGNAEGRGMVITPDGRILLAGYAHNGTNDDFALIRLFGSDQPPIVETGDATGIVRAGAVLHGTVNPNSLATTAYFEYGPTDSYGGVTSSVALGNGYLAGPVSLIVGGLTDNTLYHYRLVATNAAGTTYGEDRTFTTAPNPPLAFTGEASNITATGATLVGVALPNGRETTVYFEYGLTNAYGAVTPSQVLSPETPLADVFAPVSGLTPGSTYLFRLVAINAGSPIPITGAAKTFLAQSPPPVVTLGVAVPEGTSGVRFNGTVVANNDTTSVFFDYGETEDNLNFSLAANPGTVTGTEVSAVNAVLDGLSQGVTYHYRIRAVNGGGESTSEVASFTLDLLSGLERQFPDDPPEANGSLTVLLRNGGQYTGWRFVGEKRWRPSGATVGGMPTGDRQIEFRPVPGFIHPPLQRTVSIVSNESEIPTSLTLDYYRTEETGSGSLRVNLKPDSITTGDGRAQWRLEGDEDSPWLDSGATLPDLFPGTYLLEFKDVADRTTPSNSVVTVNDGGTSTTTVTYFLAGNPPGVLPTALPFEAVSTDQTKPYGFVGQIRSNAGLGTGFAVKERVVATAAHVVWNDATYSAAEGLQWLHQRHQGDFEPEPLSPRGFYILTGYSEQRQAENDPGNFSPQSRNRDVAALFFPGIDAARGGYSGFLASDLPNNEFLLSDADKLLVGYPVDGIASGSQGRMHATAPANLVFTPVGSQDAKFTYLSTSFRSSGGASGGPVCVQFENRGFFPAAIYLGGTSQSVVRSIDSQVISLFELARLSGIDGEPHLGGGGTHTEVTVGAPTDPGSLEVRLYPPAAVAAGAKWRLVPETALRATGDVRGSLNAGRYVVELTSLNGYRRPALQYVKINGGKDKTFHFTYVPLPVPGPEISVRGRGRDIPDGDNSPSALDGTDFGVVALHADPPIPPAPPGLEPTSIRTFVILNTGNRNLSIGSPSFTGPHPDDFELDKVPAPSIAPGRSTSFTLKFDPSGPDLRTATVTFATNDTSEDPFTFKVQGNHTADSNSNQFTDVEEAALNTLLTRFTVGQRVDLDLSFLRLGDGHTLALTGLPPGLVFNPANKRLTGTILGKPAPGHLLRKMDGTTELGSRAFDLRVFFPARLVVSTAPRRFAPTLVNRRSAAQFVRLTNSGELPLQRLAVRLGGTAPNDFLLPVRPPGTLQPGASATVSVVFRPLRKGTRLGRLILTSSDAPRSVPLSGFGR